MLTVRAIAEFLADEHKYTGDYVGGLVAGLINSIKVRFNGFKNRILKTKYENMKTY